MRPDEYSWTVEQPHTGDDVWAACLWRPGFLGGLILKIEAESFLELCGKVVTFAHETNTN